MKHGRFALFLAAVGLAAIVVWRFLEPQLNESAQTAITDAASLKANITIAVDGWIGYGPLCSSEMKKRLRRDGYGLQCVDDSADYRQRFAKLADNHYDFAVATVDSYVLNGREQGYPGAIVAVIDESRGGDALVARKSKVDTLDALKLQTQVKIAFTENSPSHHLVKSIASHFDIGALRDRSNFVYSDGSAAALKALNDQRADVAVLWEPDLSRALANPDYVRLLGTEDTHQLIVDILVAARKTVANNDAMVVALLSDYFQTLKYYSDNPDEFSRELAEQTGLARDQLATTMKGVAWQGLNDNAEDWYGSGDLQVAHHGLVNSIESAVQILMDNGDFKQHPLPNRDPYRLINSQYIAQVYQQLGQGAWNRKDASGAVADTRFPELSAEQWQRLQPVGSLKERKITFSSGNAELTELDLAEIDKHVRDLQHYPHFRIEVRGHTGTRGDPAINQQLSLARANAVMEYMTRQHNIDHNRIRAVGFGGTRPLPKRANESSRAWRYRLPRVEIVLVRESI